jgi:hypothetical protein
MAPPWTQLKAEFLHEEDLREAMEHLFFVYRDFTDEPEAILAHYIFGRDYYRVICFVGWNLRIAAGAFCISQQGA